jgi:bacterioferritin-associated ferredoxin
MYICLCNGITDRDFRAHADGEGRTVSMVYHALGKKPRCGKCVAFVRHLLRQTAEIRHSHEATATIAANLVTGR